MRNIGIRKYVNSLILIVFSFLVVFYYVLPSKMSVMLTLIVMVLSIRHIRSYIPLVWYGLFVIYIFFISSIRENQYAYLSSSCNVFLILLAFSFIIQTSDDKKLFIISTGICGGLLSLYLYVFYGSYIGVGRFGEDLPGINIQSSIMLGYIFLYVSCLQIWTIFETKKIWVKSLFFLLLLFTLYLTIFTGTRKALMLPILYYAFLLIKNNRKNKFKLLILLSMLLISIISIFTIFVAHDLIPEYQLERWIGLWSFFDSNAVRDDSSIERTQLINQGLTLFFKKPVFGYGIEATLYELGKHPHNNYITLLSFGGIIMFMLYYWIYIYIIKNSKKNITIDASIYFLILFVLSLSDLGTTSFNIMYFNICIALMFVPQNLIRDYEHR